MRQKVNRTLSEEVTDAGNQPSLARHHEGIRKEERRKEDRWMSK